MHKVDVTIIGAGVIGLAAAERLSREGRSVFVLEKNSAFGCEASSRNSEVIHSGIYYPPRSLKALLCVKGRRMLYSYLKENGVKHEKCGKLIVASSEEETEELKDLIENGGANGVEGLELIGKSELRELEPETKAEAGILSPETGIMDSHGFMQSLIKRAADKGASFSYNSEVSALNKVPSGYEISVKNEDFRFLSRAVVNCAGRDADTVAAFTGTDAAAEGYRQYLSKGCYFRVNKQIGVSRLIYPVPSAGLSDLGIHVTKDLGGGFRLGPDAEYVDTADYGIDPKKKAKFLDSASKYLKNISESDLSPDTCGIRAKLQGPGQGFRDFIINHETGKGFPGLVNLLGIESPGLTSSLAIAERVEALLSDASVL